MKTLVVDTSYLIYRSYFAYPNFLTEGKHTGAIYGVARTVMTLCKSYGIDRLVFALDLPGPTKRHEAYSEYKAGRAPMDDQMREQIPQVIEWARSVTPYVLSEAGYEADDMICSTVMQNHGEYYVLSSDRDLYQLLGDTKLHFLKGTKGGYTLYGKENFVEDFGIQPWQYTDYKALVGDGSDNIKGVPGVGPKTAGKLLTEIGGLSVLYNVLSWDKPEYFRTSITTPDLTEYLADPKHQALIQNLYTQKDSLELAYRLSLLECREVKLGEEGYDFTKGLEQCKLLQFKSIVKELGGDKKPESTQAPIDALF